MRNNKIIYSLCIQDIQTVAIDILDRKLSKVEIEKVLEPILDRMPWYDIIESAIAEKINPSKSN